MNMQTGYQLEDILLSPAIIDWQLTMYVYPQALGFTLGINGCAGAEPPPKYFSRKLLAEYFNDLKYNQYGSGTYEQCI